MPTPNCPPLLEAELRGEADLWMRSARAHRDVGDVAGMRAAVAQAWLRIHALTGWRRLYRAAPAAVERCWRGRW